MLSFSLDFLFPKMIKFVLLIFRESLLTANQMFNLSSSLDTVFDRFKMLTSEQNIFVSSANRTNLRIFETLQISFIYNMNREGPRIEPWGTPHDIFIRFELKLSKETNCFLLDK